MPFCNNNNLITSTKLLRAAKINVVLSNFVVKFRKNRKINIIKKLDSNFMNAFEFKCSVG